MIWCSECCDCVLVVTALQSGLAAQAANIHGMPNPFTGIWFPLPYIWCMAGAPEIPRFSAAKTSPWAWRGDALVRAQGSDRSSGSRRNETRTITCKRRRPHAVYYASTGPAVSLGRYASCRAGVRNMATCLGRAESAAGVARPKRRGVPWRQPISAIGSRRVKIWATRKRRRAQVLPAGIAEGATTHFRPPFRLIQKKNIKIPPPPLPLLRCIGTVPVSHSPPSSSLLSAAAATPLFSSQLLLLLSTRQRAHSDPVQ